MNDPNEYRTYLNDLVKNRRYVKIQFFTELHELITLNALIVSIGEEGNDQMAILSSGERISLPEIVSAGGRFAPSYEGYAPYCETCDY